MKRKILFLSLMALMTLPMHAQTSAGNSLKERLQQHIYFLI